MHGRQVLLDLPVMHRGDWIRTSGLVLPKHALCQAELRPAASSVRFLHGGQRSSSARSHTGARERSGSGLPSIRSA